MDFDEAELVADSERPDSRSPVRVSLRRHSMRYPLERMQEIEQEQADSYAQLEVAREADRPAARFGIRAGVFQDEVRAADKLTEVIDAGYEATMVSGTHNGELRYELQVGPFGTLKQADDVSAVLQRSFGLDPSVTVLPTGIE